MREDSPKKPPAVSVGINDKNDLPTHFSVLGLFPGLNQSYSCIFEGYEVKGICSQDIFRGIAEFSVFYFRTLPAADL
jgi:hypothetical protein